MSIPHVHCVSPLQASLLLEARDQDYKVRDHMPSCGSIEFKGGFLRVHEKMASECYRAKRCACCQLMQAEWVVDSVVLERVEALTNLLQPNATAILKGKRASGAVCMG